MTNFNLPKQLYRDLGLEQLLDSTKPTVDECLQDLCKHHPELAEYLYGEDREISPSINVYLNQEDIRDKAGKDQPVDEADTIDIIANVAGG